MGVFVWGWQTNSTANSVQSNGRRLFILTNVSWMKNSSDRFHDTSDVFTARSIRIPHKTDADDIWSVGQRTTNRHDATTVFLKKKIIELGSVNESSNLLDRKRNLKYTAGKKEMNSCVKDHSSTCHLTEASAFLP